MKYPKLAGIAQTRSDLRHAVLHKGQDRCNKEQNNGGYHPNPAGQARHPQHTADAGKIEHDEGDHHPAGAAEIHLEGKIHQVQQDNPGQHEAQLQVIEERAVKLSSAQQQIEQRERHEQQGNAHPMAGMDLEKDAGSKGEDAGDENDVGDNGAQQVQILFHGSTSTGQIKVVGDSLHNESAMFTYIIATSRLESNYPAYFVFYHLVLRYSAM